VAKNNRIVAMSLSLFPLIFVLVMLPIIPEIVPVHFGLSGVTRYGNRIEIFTLPGFAVLMQLCWVLIENAVMHQKESGLQNLKMLFWCNILLTFIITVVTMWIVYAAIDGIEELTDGRFDLLRMLSVVFNIMCIGIGNFLPKCKQNKFIGIRLSWTMKSEHNWYKTHRFGGKAYLIYGIIATLLCLLVLDGQAGLLFSVIGILTLLAIISCYSYHIYKL